MSRKRRRQATEAAGGDRPPREVSESSQLRTAGSEREEGTCGGIRSKEQLQDAMEKRLRRSLTSDEWDPVTLGWSQPYDDEDVTELVQVVRDQVSPPPKPESTEGHRWTA